MTTNCNCKAQFRGDINYSEIVISKCYLCDKTLLLRKKGDFSTANVLTKDGPGFIHSLPANVVGKDWEVFKRVKESRTTPQTKEAFFAQPNTKEILYEMLADGDIDLDQFNNFIVKRWN